MEQQQRQRRQQIVAPRNDVGSIATPTSPVQLVGDDDSQPLTCSIPYLPEGIWHHIHSLMPMRDAARSACISQAFLRSWRCHPNLALDRITLCSNPLERSFTCKIDSILRNHSGIGLKILRLDLDDDPNNFSLCRQLAPICCYTWD